MPCCAVIFSVVLKHMIFTVHHIQYIQLALIRQYRLADAVCIVARDPHIGRAGDP